VQHELARKRAQRPQTPCAHRLGERTKRQHLGRVDVTPRYDLAVSWLPDRRRGAWDPGVSQAGLALTRHGPPRAFRGFDWSSTEGPTDLLDTMTEGPARAFRPLHALSTLSAKTRTLDPVRIGDLVRRSTFRPRNALRRFLGRSAKMPRNRFYNRRFTSRAPVMKTPPLEAPHRAPWENPPSLGFEIVPGNEVFPPFVLGTPPDHLAVIRPPTAPCLTARRRLRVDRLPRLRRSACGERAPQLYRLTAAPSSRTL